MEKFKKVSAIVRRYLTDDDQENLRYEQSESESNICGDTWFGGTSGAARSARVATQMLAPPNAMSIGLVSTTRLVTWFTP
jgi:hypothetical protein